MTKGKTDAETKHPKRNKPQKASSGLIRTAPEGTVPIQESA